MTPTRPESLRDDLATIIQSGTVARKTSDEIAGEVLESIIAEKMHSHKEGAIDALESLLKAFKEIKPEEAVSVATVVKVLEGTVEIVKKK